MKSLSRRLLAPNLMFAVFTAAALGQVAYQATVQERIAERRISEVQTMTALLAELNSDVSDIQRTVLAYELQKDEALLREIERLDADVHGTIARIERIPVPPRGAVLWTELVVTQDLLEQSRKDLIAAGQAVPRDQADVLVARWRLAAEKRAALLADFTTYNVKRLGHAFLALSERRARWLLTLGVVIACSIGLAVLSATRLTRMVLRPLAAMTTTADRIATEQVALEVKGAERADEIGVLARAFNRMTSHLVTANARLAESIRARDDFLAIASHELKTPLTSAKLQLQLAGRRLGDTSPGTGTSAAPSWLAISLRQLERLETLIGSLLDVTRMRIRGLDLRPEKTDLAKIVASVVERFSADLAKSGIDARLDLERGLVGRWDPERLDQVVTNLLANVVKYAPGAPVDVVVARRDGCAIVEVRDQGPGLTHDIRERAFHPFERAASTRALGGLGLGLYIAKEIVIAHGGKISVESHPGSGADFVVRLPLDTGSTPSAADADGERGK